MGLPAIFRAQPGMLSALRDQGILFGGEMLYWSIQARQAE